MIERNKLRDSLYEVGRVELERHHGMKDDYAYVVVLRTALDAAIDCLMVGKDLSIDEWLEATT